MHIILNMQNKKDPLDAALNNIGKLLGAFVKTKL